MRTVGKIDELLVDGSVALVELLTDDGRLLLAAESRLLLEALENAFGGDWRGQSIVADHDGMLLVSFDLDE